jgi:hypothetical protein
VTGAYAVLRIPAFRRLWLAQSGAAFTERVTPIALALFTTDLTGRPSAVGLVLGAQTLSVVTFLLIGGVFADRVGRARLMIGANAARIALHGLIALAIFTGAVQLWQIVAIAALFGMVDALSLPAYVGLLPRTVPASRLQEAQALSGFAHNTAALAGPAAATVTVVVVGGGWVFAVNALVLLVSVTLLTGLRTAGPDAGRQRARRRFAVDLVEGFVQVRARAWVWASIVVFAVAIPLSHAPLYVLGPTMASDTYGSAAVFGTVISFFGLGTLMGAIGALRWRPRRPLRAAFLCLAGWPALLVTFGTASPLALVVGLAFVAGAGMAVFEIWWSTVTAERIPPDVLSRVSSYDAAGSLVLLPVGFMAAGPLAELTSPSTVLVAGGVLTAVVFAAGLIPRDTRQLQRVEFGSA